MNKVVSVIFLFVFLFVSGAAANTEQKRIVVLMSSNAESQKQVLEGFKQQIAANDSTCLVSTVFLNEMEPNEVVARVLSERPTVILTVGRSATLLAKENIKEKQIVYCMVFNSPEYSMSNITGVTLDINPETKLRMLKKLYPAAKTVGILYSSYSVESYSELSAAASNQGLNVIGKKVESDSEFPNALREIYSRTDCLLMVVDANIYFGQTVKYLLLESLKNSIPVFGLSSFYTKAGAFASFDCDYTDIGCQSADMVEEIISGANASIIKIQRPRKFQYSINAVVAAKMQIKLSPQVLKEATEIFN